MPWAGLKGLIVILWSLAAGERRLYPDRDRRAQWPVKRGCGLYSIWRESAWLQAAPRSKAMTLSQCAHLPPSCGL